MNLRNQLSLTLLGVFGLLTAANMLVQHFVSRPGYERLESALAQKDAERVDAAIRREIDALDKFALEWAVWDDAYTWVGEEHPNNEFVISNLSADSYYNQSHTPVFVFTDARGKTLFASIKNPDTYENETVPEFAPEAFAPGGLLFPAVDAPDFSGIMMTARGPTLVVSRRVVPTAADRPSAGRFIAARYLDSSSLNTLREQVGVQFTLVSGAAAPIITGGDHALTRTRDGGTVEVVRPLPCLTPGATLAAVSMIPRSVTAEGFKSMNLSQVAMLVSAGAITLSLVSILGTKVVGPIQKLQRHAAKVGTTGDLSSRLELDYNNEIGALAHEFNDMVAGLESAQHSVAEMSRRAGMAQVASGVLHNVGNAMNSATVSVSTLGRLVAESKLTALTKVADLIGSQPNLAEFFANDPRAAQIPVFLSRLAQGLAAEREELDKECRRLSLSVAHVNEIVRAHQDIANSPETAEQLPLSEVIEHAVALVKPSFERHDITLTVGRVPSLRAGFFRAKLQQVLVNLLTNAAQAVKPFDAARRNVTINAGINSNADVWIEVSDLGPGFTAMQQSEFFTQGFTTKTGGHGLGLHYCAVAMSQMKGSIHASSAGPDRGAVFRIEFPTQVSERRVAA